MAKAFIYAFVKTFSLGRRGTAAWRWMRGVGRDDIGTPQVVILFGGRGKPLPYEVRIGDKGSPV